MAPPGHDLTRAPGHLIRRAQQMHQTLWAQRVGSDLTSVQFAVLALLARQPEIDQRTLGVSLSIDTSTLADVCRRLADKGLLERRRDVNDARRYVLRVTPSATTLLKRTIPVVDAVGDALLVNLSPDERDTLIDLLQRVLLSTPQAPGAETMPDLRNASRERRGKRVGA
jgi:DNA-binding MarR family transcriptional regulator